MHFVRQIDNLLAKTEGFCITFILSMMIALSFGQVILRNLFNGGILWGDTLLRQLVLWVGFLGASIAAREKRHISIDFLPQFLPEPWRNPIRVFINLVTALITGVLAWTAWVFVRFEQEGGSILFLDIPVWIFQIILPYSFLVISLRFLLNALSGMFPTERTE
ncbi:MAG: TRAP transporter small permease [Nitrospinaceae bacterium]